MDKKRLAIIIGFALLTVLFGWGLYRIFFAKPSPRRPAPTEVAPRPGAPGAFPEAGIGAPPGAVVAPPGALPRPGAVERPALFEPAPERPVTALTEDPVVSAGGDKSGGANYYNQIDGKFYRVAADGSIHTLSDEVFYNVERVTWSPKGTAGILEYPDGSNVYYDFEAKKQSTLPRHWEEFTFSSQGDRVGAKSIGFSPENRWIVTANPDGAEVTRVAALGNNADKVTLDWSPNRQIIGTSRTGDPLGADRQEVLFVGLHGENFRSIIVEGRGLQSNWSPDGKQLLYSVYSAQSGFKPELWIVNAEGDAIGTGRHPLGVQTWASKCAFGDPRFAYCAVPEMLEVGSGFAPAIADAVADRLLKIDTQTGTRTEIPLREAHTMQNLFLSPDGKTLFFGDKTKSGLFRVAL